MDVRIQETSDPAIAANKHQQRTEATRQRLISAALRIFTRDGFFAARIEDIAAAAGYTRGAFYANFESKEDLFLAMLEAESTKHLQRLRKLLQSAPEHRRRGILRGYFVSRASDPQWPILVLEFKLYAFRRGKVGARWVRALREIREKLRLEFLESLNPLGTRDLCERELRRILLEVVLNGLVLERAYDAESMSDPELRKTLGRAFDMVIGPSLVRTRH